MPLQYRTITLIAIALVVVVFFLIQHFSTAEYASLAALNAEQKMEGFVPIGRFGESWPALIVEVRENVDRIRFKRSNGQQHIYQSFDGYLLRMVRLKSRTMTEVIGIYRSEVAESQPEPGMGQSDQPIVRKL